MFASREAEPAAGKAMPLSESFGREIGGDLARLSSRATRSRRWPSAQSFPVERLSRRQVPGDADDAQSESDTDDVSPLLLQAAPSARQPEAHAQHARQATGKPLSKHRLCLTLCAAIPVACVLAQRNAAVEGFTPGSWLTIAVTLEALVLMAHDLAPDFIMLGAAMLLRLCGIITEEEVWRGFSSTGVLAIGVLFVVAKSLESAGTIELFARSFLGGAQHRPRVGLSVLRLCVPVVLVSAIVNDTPLVAMMIPIVLKWATANGLPADWLLLPLSYSALLGGVVTLIGSSTNLVLADLMLADRAQGHDPGFQLEFFSTTPVALPVALIGVAYLALTVPVLLPGHVSRTPPAMSECQHPGTPAATVGGDCALHAGQGGDDLGDQTLATSRAACWNQSRVDNESRLDASTRPSPSGATHSALGQARSASNATPITSPTAQSRRCVNSASDGAADETEEGEPESGLCRGRRYVCAHSEVVLEGGKGGQSENERACAYMCDHSKHIQVCANFSSVWSGSASFAQGVGIGAWFSPVRLPRISLSIARLFAFLPRPLLHAGTT